MNRAKLAVAEIKRRRVEEGPEDSGVFIVSQKVGRVVVEREKLKQKEDYFDATLAMSKGVLNDRIREGIKEENVAI